MASKSTLRRIFGIESVTKIWRKRVWPGLRDQGCEDLIEYYDYNSQISQHLARLIPAVVNGNYKTTRSLSLEENKGDGLARHVQVPNPDDALILQVLVEEIVPTAVRKAPSKRAYFSRSRSTPKGLQHNDFGNYPWFKLWPKYQTEILEFSKVRKYLVITDIANYFDSIPHKYVDRSLSMLGVDQTVRDLVMYCLEGFSLRDLYGPLVRKGLPQLDFDAPRLLAHVLLYSVDAFLERRTGGCYARWVDDINFAVDRRQDAKELIRSIERFLARVELRLNAQKTVVLSKQQAEDYLCVVENQRLTGYKNLLDSGEFKVGDADSLGNDFLHYRTKIAKQKYGYWDKVYRRYVNLISRADAEVKFPAKLRRDIFAATKDDFGELTDYRIRESIVRYWHRFDATKANVGTWIAQFYAAGSTDDVISYKIAELLAIKNLSVSNHQFLLKKLDRIPVRPGPIAGVCLLLCKYGDLRGIRKFVELTTDVWSVNDFLSRQIIALWSTLEPNARDAQDLERLIASRVQRGPADLLAYFKKLRNLKAMLPGLEGYVSPAAMKRPYTISKAIVASNLLRSANLPEQIRSRIVSALSSVQDDRIKAIALNTMLRE